MGSFMLRIVGRNLLMEGGGNREIVDSKGGGEDERLADRHRMAVERDEVDQRGTKGRGGGQFW